MIFSQLNEPLKSVSSMSKRFLERFDQLGNVVISQKFTKASETTLKETESYLFLPMNRDHLEIYHQTLTFSDRSTVHNVFRRDVIDFSTDSLHQIGLRKITEFCNGKIINLNPRLQHHDKKKLAIYRNISTLYHQSTVQALRFGFMHTPYSFGMIFEIKRSWYMCDIIRYCV